MAQKYYKTEHNVHVRINPRFSTEIQGVGWSIEIGDLCSNSINQKHSGAMNVILKQLDITLHIYHTGTINLSN